MRWISEPAVMYQAPTRRKPQNLALRCVASVLLSGLLCLTVLLGLAADEKRITVYSTAANYSLPVVEHNGSDYVGLLEVLEPLGQVTGKFEGRAWKFRYEKVDAEFHPGKSRYKIRGKEADLFGPFVYENNRGLVPLASLTSLLPRFLGGPVTFHETARRLFVGNVATDFGLELANNPPSRLVFNFSAPVSPSVSTEPGKLRMTFTRDPLPGVGTQSLTSGDNTFSSVNYQESNGAAEIVVASGSPLMASFSNGGKTITVALAPGAQAAAQAPPSPPLSATPPPASAPTSSQDQGTEAAPAVHARTAFAVIDASHGGSERGAALTEQLPEKDVTLAIARQLRQELQKRGIASIMLRDSDATITLDQRAAATNGVHPMIYVAIHASSQGQGVRIFTPILPAGSDNRGVFQSWDTAQAPSLNASNSAAAAISAEMQKRQLAVRTLSVPLRPLNNVTSAAVAIEVAPPEKVVLDLTSVPYQQAVTSALADGIAQLRTGNGAPR
jgi:N-acetylmuramoyl-L-alanine amidase